MKRCLLFALIFLFLITACQPTLKSTPLTPSSDSSQKSELKLTPTIIPDTSSIPDCGDDLNKPLFDVSPLKMTDFTGLIPLGNLSPPSHTFPTNHIYFHIRRTNPTDYNSPTESVPVFSPGRVWITRIAVSEHLSANPPFADYSIHFSPCSQFLGYYLHVQSLSPALLEELGSFEEDRCNTYETGGEVYRHCEKRDLNIEISAGEELGSTGGREGQNAFDFGAYDARIPPLEYANPARHYTNPTGFDQLHIVCPIDYYPPDMRDQFRARFGDSTGNIIRTIEPFCGEVEQDVPGTAQGIWYLSGTQDSFPEDPHIALVHDNVDPAWGAFSVGTSLQGIAPGIYHFAPNNTGNVNRDFSHITANEEIFCYEPLTRFHDKLPFIILVQLSNDTELHIEKQERDRCGSGAWNFSSAQTVFER